MNLIWRVYFIPAFLGQKALKNESGPGGEPLDFWPLFIDGKVVRENDASNPDERKEDDSSTSVKFLKS